MKAIKFTTEDAISSIRAQAELGSAQFEYEQCKRGTEEIQVIMIQKINRAKRQKTFYFKLKNF